MEPDTTQCGLRCSGIARARKKRYGALGLALACVPILFSSRAVTRGDDRQRAAAPDEDDAVLAIIAEDDGLGGQPKLIQAVWADGRIVWSEDRLEGGPPFQLSRIDPQRVATLIARLVEDGIFVNRKFAEGKVEIHGRSTRILVRFGRRALRMDSSHEIGEAEGNLVATDRGLVPLQDRRRYEVLKGESAEYLLFRLVWSEVRRSAAELIPSMGEPFVADVLFGRDRVAWPARPMD